MINWNDPVRPVPVFQQSLRPYPEFFDPARPDLGVQNTGRIRYIDSFGESFYHGLQLKLDKRMSRGVLVGFHYTYSKSFGDGEAGGQEGASFQDPRDRRGSRGLFSFDQTHRTVLSFVWELPGKSLHGPVGQVIGGWQLNGIFAVASGFPYTITNPASDLGLPNGAPRPDVIGQAERDDPTRKLWFNPSAYQRVTCQIPSRPDLCHFGSAGYDQLRGPGMRNLDFGLYKNFKIQEKANIQFRWEAFNATNTPWFSNPNGISFSSANQITPNGSRDGEIRSIQSPMRRMQFALKVSF